MRVLIHNSLILDSCTLILKGQSIETVIQKGHELAVIAVAISPDSNYVATGSRDKSAKLCALARVEKCAAFQGHEAK